VPKRLSSGLDLCGSAAKAEYTEGIIAIETA